MPTALPLAFYKSDAPLERRAGLGIAINADLTVAAAFTGLGFALAIGLAVLFPQAANAAALALIVA